MRFWFSGPRLFGGFIRPGVSFNVGGRSRRPASNQVPAADFVYVVHGSHGLTKVGISTDPAARLATLQTASPERLWLAFTAPGYGNAYTIEQEAHRILAAHRVGGEWFSVTPDLAIAAVFGAADRTGCSISAGAPSASASSADKPATAWWAFLEVVKIVLIMGSIFWGLSLLHIYR